MNILQISLSDASIIWDKGDMPKKIYVRRYAGDTPPIDEDIKDGSGRIFMEDEVRAKRVEVNKELSLYEDRTTKQPKDLVDNEIPDENKKEELRKILPHELESDKYPKKPTLKRYKGEC